MFADRGHEVGDGLVLLEDAPWPEAVKRGIVGAYARHGDKIAGRKLVEPTAQAFWNNYKEIDWDLLAEYFAWEAASIHNKDEATALQELCLEKRGFYFSHYPIYDVRG